MLPCPARGWRTDSGSHRGISLHSHADNCSRGKALVWVTGHREGFYCLSFPSGIGPGKQRDPGPQAHIGLGFICCRLGGVLDICFPEPLFFPCLPRHSPYASVRNRAERVWECRNMPWVPGERGERQGFFSSIKPCPEQKEIISKLLSWVTFSLTQGCFSSPV